MTLSPFSATWRTDVARFLNRLIAGPDDLSWIETGTWTPAFAGQTAAGTYTYSSQVGEYTRIGDLVFATFQITISGVSSAGTGNALITGLPFPISSTGGPGRYSSVPGAVTNVASLPSNFGAWSLASQGGQSHMRVGYVDTSAGSQPIAQTSIAGAGFTIRGNFQYRTGA